MDDMLRILSWNVNGIRAALKKGFMEFIGKDQPDIICLQETKACREQVQIDPSGYKQYWNSAEKKGYAGTAVFTRLEPLGYRYGVGEKEHDREGRVITLEFSRFFLVNVYTPNSGRALERLDYRKKWDQMFLKFLKALEKKKPVIVCGDMNVAHKEIDIANPQANKTTRTRPGNAGFTDQERAGFQAYIDDGFLDTFREFNKDSGNYSWWSYMFNARARNVGWRIDYFLISERIRPLLKDAFIMPEIPGSDHCPVGILIKIPKRG